MRSRIVLSILSTVIFCALIFGLIAYKLDMEKYTLYSSSRTNDVAQDIFVATFDHGFAEDNLKRCENYKKQLLEKFSSGSNYECRQGPYIPYKFMLSRSKPIWLFWKLKIVFLTLFASA